VYKKGSSARPSPMASKVKTDFPGVERSVEGGKYFIGYSCKQVEHLSAGAHIFSLVQRPAFAQVA
jgi:hypothetical protein